MKFGVEGLGSRVLGFKALRLMVQNLGGGRFRVEGSANPTP